MSKKGMTLAESFEAIYVSCSWSDLRSELVEQTWKIVGYPIKESAMKAIGL